MMAFTRLFVHGSLCQFFGKWVYNNSCTEAVVALWCSHDFLIEKLFFVRTLQHKHTFLFAALHTHTSLACCQPLRWNMPTFFFSVDCIRLRYFIFINWNCPQIKYIYCNIEFFNSTTANSVQKLHGILYWVKEYPHWLLRTYCHWSEFT